MAREINTARQYASHRRRVEMLKRLGDKERQSYLSMLRAKASRAKKKVSANANIRQQHKRQRQNRRTQQEKARNVRHVFSR